MVSAKFRKEVQATDILSLEETKIVNSLGRCTEWALHQLRVDEPTAKAPLCSHRP